MLQDVTVTAALPLLADVCILVGMIGLMCWLQPALTLVALLPVPKLPGMGAAVGKNQIRKYYEQEGQARLAAAIAFRDALGLDAELGSIEPGKLADLVVVGENPLANLKVLYGTGWVRVGEDNTPKRVGGVVYTVKDGIVYDAKKLLADVKAMVDAAKKKEGIERLVPPGM